MTDYKQQQLSQGNVLMNGVRHLVVALVTVSLTFGFLGDSLPGFAAYASEANTGGEGTLVVTPDSDNVAKRGAIMGALAGAWLGVKSGSATGAACGVVAGPAGSGAGTIVGGVIGGIIGGVVGGYVAAELDPNAEASADEAE